MSPEQEIHTLRVQVAQLLAGNTHLQAHVRELLALVAELRGTIAAQQDHIAKLVKTHFGRTSERIEGPTLFDDLPDEPVPPPATPGRPEPEVLVPKRKGHAANPTRRTCPGGARRST